MSADKSSLAWSPLRRGVSPLVFCLAIILLFSQPASAARTASDFCPPLAAPTGNIIHVSTTDELVAAVNSAAEGDAILLADGIYSLESDYVWIDVPGVTLRSASGNRNAVILDANYQGGDMVSVAASNVTIADLTIRRAYYHPIHVFSTDTSDTLNTLIYNVHIIDPGQQAIKINPSAARTHFVDNGVVACSTIELTDAGRAEIRDDCYTGGVDAHAAQGWTVRDNVISGFWCDYGFSEHGIHFWNASRDTLVERNRLLDNARGIGFGLSSSGSGRTYSDAPCPDATGYVDHYGGLIRNNFVAANRTELFASEYGFDCGICLWNACQVQAYHNSIASTQAPVSSSIEWRFSNTSVELANNLASGPLLERDGASATQSGNLADQSTAVFLSPATGDLHLAPGHNPVIGQGAALASGLCDADIDGDPRPSGGAREPGADEQTGFAIWLPMIQIP